jgi:hypothetical protein
MRRATIALVLVSLLLAPVVGAGGAIATPTSTQETTGVSGALGASSSMVQTDGNNSTENTTATATPTPTPTPATVSESGPETAQTVRILPVQLNREFVSVSVETPGEIYNTSGPFAIFSVSEPVDQAAIQQPGATATVLEGGRQVKVEYEPDAAPVGGQSLYQLELYWSDGSSKSVDLYAERTSVDVGSAEMTKYRPLVLDILRDAEENGYERSPEGAEEHYKDVKSTAQLLDSLFTEQAARLFASLISIISNPLGIAAVLVSAAVLAYWQLSRNRSVLDILSNDSGKSARLRERLWIQYKRSQQTAAEEPLRELKGVGEMGEIYWKDAYGVDTVAGLAELFRQGMPVRRDGEIKHVGGVEDLDVESIHSSWLEAVCRDHRLPSVEVALAHGKTALRRMVSEYGMAHIYDETYETTRELLDELDESRDVSRYSAEGPSRSSFGAGDPAPGDD